MEEKKSHRHSKKEAFRYTDEEIEKITGATRHENIDIPLFWYPPMYEAIKNWLEAHLISTGGRRTVQEAKVARRIKFSKRNWELLELIARKWSSKDKSISPAQVAMSIIDNTLSLIMKEKMEMDKKISSTK